MHSILVIDDDERLLSLIVQLLKISGYDATPAKSAIEARNIISYQSFDAIIVDWMMPKESGIEFIKTLRSSASQSKNIPALMLTAMGDIDNKIEGFEAGFDDYLVKPFEERELLARLASLIRRNTIKEVDSPTITFGNCVFNLTTGEFLHENNPIYLTSTEIILLKTLCQKKNQPISREDLSQKLGFKVNDRTIDVQITRLRKKIGDNPKEPAIIQTIRHIGYSIIIKE